MKKQTSQKKPAPAAKPKSVSVTVQVYPHVIQIQRNGVEVPSERVMHPTDEIVAALAKKLAAVPGNVVKVELLDSHGRKRE